jgi:hypothetical protein
MGAGRCVARLERKSHTRHLVHPLKQVLRSQET